MSYTVLFQTPECTVCHKVSEVELPVGPYEAWRAGQLIQVAFPDMSADDRELLVSGTHPPCWDALMGDAKE